MNEIEREVSIEQVDYNIDINDNNYTIEIDSPSEYIIELNEQGPQGLRGYTGNGISSFELTSSSGLVDTYTVTFTDGETTTINVTNGNGISSIAKTSTVGLEDEYTITFDNGGTETFTVTNGEKGDTGNGIASISLTSTSGLVDTYTITFTNGDTTTFDVTNGEEGNGISSINKTSTSGLVDTYTITFTNGDTETFTVTNGKNGQDGAAATISVGSTTTGNPGTSASVTNSGTSSAAVLDFVIPQGVQGETGATGADGYSPTATVTKSGNTATITITDKNGTTTATVSDGSGASSISQLTDVDLTGLSNGDVLVYDSTSQEWKAEAQSGGGGDVTDVEVNGESVVTDGVAEIDLTGYQEKLTAGTDLEITAQNVINFTNDSGYVKSSELPTIGNGTIIVKEGATEKGRFTLNQNGNTTINLTQVGTGMITFMQDGKQSGRMSANRATDMTITLKGLYDYESVNADMVGDNLVQANNNRVTGFSSSDYIVMREPITLPQYWEYDVDFSIEDTAEGIGDEQYIFSDVNNTFALKENEDDQLFESFTLYVNGSPVASNIEAEAAYYNIKFIKGMDENYNIVGSGNTIQCYVYIGYSSSAQKELVGSFTSSTAPTTIQTIFGVNSNHAKPLSDGSYIDFTKCFIDEITRSGNTVTKTRIWDGLVKTIDTKVNTWDLDNYVKSVNNELPDANGNVDVKGLYDYYTINANIVGTPTVSDYTVSDFTSSDYVQMRETLNFGATPWEWWVQFTTGTIPTLGGNFQYIFYSSRTQLYLDAGNPGNLGITLGSVSTSFGPLSANTTYKVRIITGADKDFNSASISNIYLYDENDSLLASTSVNSRVAQIITPYYGIQYSSSANSPFDGSIDFENSYINQIDTTAKTTTRVWTGIIPIIDTKADYSRLDGQWVTKDQVIASNVSFATGGSETKTYSLASYLPNDGATYEVLFALGGQSAATSGSSFGFVIATDIVSNVFMCRSIARTAAYVFSYGNAIVPLTTKQVKVTQANNTSGTPTMSSLRMCGYRRVGTNS